MSLTLVTGGTGHLGRDILDRIVSAGHRTRVLARSPTSRKDVEWAIGDLATGAGLREALSGVDSVINAATASPIARRGGFRPVDFFTSPSAVDVEGTERLLSLAREQSVQPFLHVVRGKLSWADWLSRHYPDARAAA
jgi:nucleoside-diphosphate-sugar epimerase